MYQYHSYKISRNQVVVSLMITTMLAACGAPAIKTTSNEPAPIPAPTAAQSKADATVDASKVGQDEIKFTDLEGCTAETERLNAEYIILQEAFDSGKLTGEAPIKPSLQPDECEAFLASAEEQYAAEAPTYADQNACEAEGADCERVDPSPNNNYVQTVYRPIFYGGYAYNPWLAPVYFGGRRNYGQHTTIIYRDSSTSNSGGFSSGGSRTTTTSPKATTSTTTTTGKSSTKPAATSGSNAITGRGTSGFGSSYKSTGKGGK